MTRVKIGVQLSPQHTSFADYRQAWLRLDDLGTDSILNWDHFFPLSGDPDGRHYEGWTSLAVLAAQTRRAQVGCLVLAMSYRNPALLSAMARTLDVATDGRLILGVGAGWNERDYAEYGYSFGTAGDRLRNLERGLEVIRQRWQRDQPGPVRGSIPILVGGGGEKVTLRIVAQYADMWHGSGEPGTWSRKNRILDDWCARVGRDPGAIERLAALNPRTLQYRDGLFKEGATHFIYELGAPYDVAPVEDLLAWRDRQNRA